MSSVSAVNSTATATNSASDTTSRIPVQTLGQQDFLKLLVAQLTTQDPLKPQTDTEYIAQMAQFSSLEQSKSMQQDIALMREQQAISQASGLIGKEVMLLGEDDTVTQGVVSAVQIQDSSPKLIVGGQTYDLSQLMQMTEAATDSTAQP